MAESKPNEPRHRPGVLREYEGDGIRVHWEPALCIHTGRCFAASPEAFDPQARPWVRPLAASADAIADAIRRCPTGALSYVRTDGEPGDEPRVPTTVQPRLNGPLFLEGDLVIVDLEGETVRSGTRFALCRCGYSKNKPFCDLTHRAVDFRS